MAGTTDAIVLAAESSPTAGRVTGVATRLAGATGWPLVIVAVWSVPAAATAFESLHETVEREDAARAGAAEACEHAAASAAAAGLEARTLVLNGDAAAEICAVAEREHAALIVIGAHSGRVLPRGSLGAVSDDVVRHAPCPVLVVPAR